MEEQEYNHTGRHFFHRKAIVEYYDATNILIRYDEFDIEPERRFLFHGLELDKLYVSYSEVYEIIIFEEFSFANIDGKNYYVTLHTGLPLTQDRVDQELVKKLYGLNIEKVSKFLSYHLKKYQNRKDQLHCWKSLIENSENLAESLYGTFRPELKKVALEWINGRLRRRNLREYQSSKDMELKDIFVSHKSLESVLIELGESENIRYNQFHGRYDWLKGGQDLAVLGEVLQNRNYFKDWIDYSVRHNALTKFFNVMGKKGFSDRTFRRSTIEEVYDIKKGQYTSIRPIL